jgi:hypothetical protein
MNTGEFSVIYCFHIMAKTFSFLTGLPKFAGMSTMSMGMRIYAEAADLRG